MRGVRYLHLFIWEVLVTLRAHYARLLSYLLFFALLEGATCSLNVRARNTKRGRLNLEPVRSEANQMGKRLILLPEAMWKGGHMY